MPRKSKVGLLTVIRDESNVRGLIALIFMLMFSVFVLGSIILATISLFMTLDGKVAEAKELILTLSGVFSGPLGLILGYYFRSEIEKKISP